MILGTKARYAVMAMVELARHNPVRPITLAALAGSQEIALPYLEQIFSKLKKANIVQSVRGPGGGYVLSRPASMISISDIIEATEESLKMTRCDSHSEKGCMAAKTRCLTHDLWEGLGAQIHSYLSAISLEDVCQGRLAGAKSLANIKQCVLSHATNH